MRRVLTILLLCCCGWISAQNFPYQVSVETIPGHCYDDARLIITLLDDAGNEIQIDPQTHNAVNVAQYPLYNVQYHYQNVTGGTGVQYDYNHDIRLMAGTYCVGVTARIAPQASSAQVDTTICNVQLTTSYQHLEAAALFNLASNSDWSNREMYGYRPSFRCKDMGRIQLQITQGTFPYEVTILDEQQDTVRHAIFYDRVNNGASYLYADYRDYYTFDTLAIGTYSITVSDSCGYAVPITFTIPDATPGGYSVLVNVKNNYCPDESIVPFRLEIKHTPQNNTLVWYEYFQPFFDSILHYRFINPENDTTEWMTLPPVSWYDNWNIIGDTMSSYCTIFDDTVRVQVRDLCLDTLLTFSFRFLPQYDFFDRFEEVHAHDSTIQDTCAVHLLSGITTQSYRVEGEKGAIFSRTGSTLPGWNNEIMDIPFRYYTCPLTYNIWSSQDSTLLGQSQSDEFSELGTWLTFYVDTILPVHISVTDDAGCEVAAKDTVFVYQTEPVDDLLFWFECHNDKDDDGKDHCCEDRYLWIQEHGVEANTFRRNMTLRLMDSPLYDQFNFTAVRQDGEWTVTFDEPDNHSTYVDFSYEDGWRATIRDSVCLPPGRYTFEVSTDCGVDTITYEWVGFYYDSIEFTSAPQYEMQQVCDHIVVTQVSTGLENYIYTIDPSVSNDEPIQENTWFVYSSSTTSGINATKDSQGRSVFVFSVPGTYCIQTRSYNNPYSTLYRYLVSYWCTSYHYYYDTITVAFSHLEFDRAVALLCDSLSESGIVYVKAVNGNSPYTYMLYNGWGATGSPIASNTTGFFEDVPMTAGQQFSVMVTDSCSTSFSVNLTAALRTYGSLLWEPGVPVGSPHCAGDTLHLSALAFPAPATYQWTGPNGFSGTSQTSDVVLSYDGSGWYKVEIRNSFCGSLITDSLYVTVLPTDLYDTICQGAGYNANGFTLTDLETNMAGTFTRSRAVETSSGGCTVTLHLTILPAGTSTEEVVANGSYVWNGVTYTESGTYIKRFPTAGDCDSVATLILTITRIPVVSIVPDGATVCEGDSVVLQAVIENPELFVTPQAPPIAVGDILCTDSSIVKPSAFAASGKTALGIVFFVDSTDEHGWAMDLHDVEGPSPYGFQWSPNESMYVDVPTLDNIDNSRDAIGDFDGYGNTQKLRAAGNATLFPAVWAVDFDHGWYLPAIGQMVQLHVQIITLNASLVLVGGTPFDLDSYYYYWSSTEGSNGNAWNLVYGGSPRDDWKNYQNFIRSVRNF